MGCGENTPTTFGPPCTQKKRGDQLDVFVEFVKTLHALLQLVLLLFDMSIIVALLPLFIVQPVLIHLLLTTHGVQFVKLRRRTLTCLLLQPMIFLHLTAK